MTITLVANLSGRVGRVQNVAGTPTPLIVAIHGGSYTSAYFDIPGHSFLDTAVMNGVPVVAIDRPGYGHTPLLRAGEAGIWGQASHLKQILGTLWETYGAGLSGMVLVGHSIGAAIAATVASDPSDFPLLGLAISGVGMRTPDDHEGMWNALPQQPLVDLPAAAKDQFMFGPAGRFDPGVQALSHQADALAVREELIDIVTHWKHRVAGILANIAVPVHYRQGSDDHLWMVSPDEVDHFARALTKAPRVDAALLERTGHCMDFHLIGRALHIQQIGFALQCAAENGV